MFLRLMFLMILWFFCSYLMVLSVNCVLCSGFGLLVSIGEYIIDLVE